MDAYTTELIEHLRGRDDPLLREAAAAIALFAASDKARHTEFMLLANMCQKLLSAEHGMAPASSERVKFCDEKSVCCRPVADCPEQDNRRQPTTLTDAEREAILFCIECCKNDVRSDIVQTAVAAVARIGNSF